MPAPGEGPIGYHLDRVQEELYVVMGAGINWRAGLCAPGRKAISAVSAGNHRQNSEVSVRARQTWERGGMKVLRWIWLSCSAAYFWKRLMSSANSSSSTRRQRCATHRLCPYLAPMEKEEMGGLCQSPFGGPQRCWSTRANQRQAAWPCAKSLQGDWWRCSVHMTPKKA
jgi:hypothetical protein